MDHDHYQPARTLTDILISRNVLVHDERKPEVIRKSGVGKEIKRSA